MSQDGSGTTTLALNNSYSGGTFINNGALQVGNNGNTGSLGSGPVVNNGSLVLMRSDAFFNMANTLSGSGSIFQSGGGTTTLSGPAGGFTGPITVNTGNVYLNGAISSSSITVAPGAVLGGKGTVSAGTAELQSGATIEAGQGGTGSLTLAGLTLDNIANININNILQYSSTNNSAINPPAAIKVTGACALRPDHQPVRDPSQPRRRCVLQHCPARCPHPGVYRLEQPRGTGQSHRREQSDCQHPRHQRPD